ncbi:MAG: pseudouridine-5'-phosphate glycosidase [Aureispira sp.]|nr:pseudouridine-5'-phosphate glycosidase [Aureispira sp.]
MFKQYIDIAPEVQKALDNNQPVVALESTIISHGMPYPKNVETAREVEQIVRKYSATPATIAILNGRIKIGLTEADLELLGKEKNVQKVSRRDLPFIIAKGLNGATTVAATMILADLAGIRIFVTGGIGGVHRGASETFDISADLQELATTDVAVICAGVKSILDIGLTLEYLETQGVPVVAVGTKEFPAFYTRKSGFEADYQVDDLGELAKALHAKWDLGLKGGMVIGNPIDKAFEMDSDIIDTAIQLALKEARKKGIQGKDITPFLLAKIVELTSGQSLDSNIQLVYNNAKIGAQLAVAYHNS